MSTAVTLLALGLAVAVAAGSLGDHATVITNRNLAAHRAERAATTFIASCAGGGCDPSTVNAARSDGTVLSGCLSGSTGSPAMRVVAHVPWNPRVLSGLAPATATTVVELAGFGASASEVLESC